MDQLFKGNIQLPAEATSQDILKSPPAPSERACLPRASLPPSASDLLNVLPDNTMPDIPFKVIVDQARFEDVAVDLRPCLSAAVNIYTAANLSADSGTASSTALHHDHNFMVAQRLLESTGDEGKARDSVKFAGSNALLSID
jgi:hypothetical protein